MITDHDKYHIITISIITMLSSTRRALAALERRTEVDEEALSLAVLCIGLRENLHENPSCKMGNSLVSSEDFL
jgi:hypothetical protein